jgi:hypothetical protein
MDSAHQRPRLIAELDPRRADVDARRQRKHAEDVQGEQAGVVGELHILDVGRADMAVIRRDRLRRTRLDSPRQGSWHRD